MDEAIHWLLTGDKKQLKISSTFNKVNGEEEFYYFNKIKETHNLLVKDFHDIEEKQNQLIETERIKSLGQLIGGIAHNLKTPLMTSGAGIEIINKNISRLQKCIDNDKQIPSELINEIKYWSHLIENNLIYVSDIISAVKGQAQEPNENNCCNFSVKQLINRINLLMRFELEKNKCILKIESVLDESQDLKGDIISLIQVFNTLITNAIEACQNDHQITFGILIDDSNIKFYVKNVGKGIPAEIKSKLFNSMITTKGKNGTGMGLYIAQSIINSKFNGEISFEDDINTTFYVKIPMNILLSSELLTVA
jgi:signal transduction histidine kinase